MQSIREMHCRPAVILEIARPSPASTRDELVELAKQYSQMGADVLCLKARCVHSTHGWPPADQGHGEDASCKVY